MQQKLIVVSMDALIYEDLAYLSQKPNFKYLLGNGALVHRVRSIYPTLTYPCHATMATGCFPAKHRVLNNTQLIPGQAETPWNWFHDVYRVRDLFDAAKEKGLTTACVGWPSMGRHPHVDYLVAEIAHTKAVTEEQFRKDYELTGTSPALWDRVCKPHIYLRTEENNVQLFNTAVCCELIRTYKPDLVMMHLANPDKARHKFGVYGKEVENALDECDRIAGMLRQAVSDSGVDYNLVITSDHGQLDIYRFANVNALFLQNGFNQVDKDDSLTCWRAWCHGTGLSATVYVKDPSDEQEVYEFLQDHIGEGYSRVYTREEAAAEGFAGEFAFVLETDGQTEFKDHYLTAYYTPLEAVRGSHGHHPDKGPRSPFIGTGPAFKKGAVMEHAHLTDGAPTYAKILEVALPDADGCALTELLI